MRAYLSLAGFGAILVGWFLSTGSRNVEAAAPEPVLLLAAASGEDLPVLRRETVESPGRVSTEGRESAPEPRRPVRIVYPPPYEAR